MNDSHASPARSPRRFSSEPPPSLLLVGGSDDLRLFLRAGVQRWYQVAEACEGAEAVPHLTHCPPCGLIVGQLTGDGEEALRAGLREHAAPPVLKLWVRNEPGGWVDRGLRHPFTHADLLRAVTRLVAGEGGDTVGQEAPRPADVQIEAGARS